MGQPLPAFGHPSADRPFLAASDFRFASLRARVRTDDPEFRSRLHDVLHDCLEPGSEDAHAELEVRAGSGDGPIAAFVSRHAEPPPGASIDALFPELDLVAAAGEPDWESWALRESPARTVVATRGGALRVARDLPWQILVTHYFLHHLMRLQPEWLFLHGATLAIGRSGVLLAGDKGAGKSTLSMALAVRGHGFLGDEIATIHKDTGEIAPFRRAVSLRSGPQAEKVRSYLERFGPAPVRLSDGTDRVRLPASRVLSVAGEPVVKLSHAIFLAGVADVARAQPFDFSLSDVALLSPMHGMLRRRSSSDVVALLNSFRPVRCYRIVRGGTPDELAALVEAIVEGKWDTPCRKEPSTSVRSAGSRSS